MADPTAYYVDPSINGNSGSGTIGDPYGDLQYALNQVSRDTSNGDIFHIKAGTAEVLSSGLTLATYGGPSNLAPLLFRGYTSAAEDGGIFEIDCDGNGLFAFGSYNYITLIDGEAHNSGASKLIDGVTGWTLINMELHNGTNTSELVELGSYARVIGCYIHDTATSGSLLEVSTGSIVYGNFLKSGRDDLIRLASSRISVHHNVIFCTDTGSTGILFANNICAAISNTIYNSTAGTQEGIHLSNGSSYLNTITNNIIEGWSGTGGAGVSMTSSPNQLLNNAFYNNTTNISSTDGLTIEIGTISLSSSPFTDPSSNNFKIKDGETDIQGAAYPSNTGGDAITTTPTYLDIGAVQREEAGGGGAIIIHGSSNGGFQ